MAPPAILVLGSVNTDLVVLGPRLPAPGETVLGGRFYQAHGGKGANQAVAAARAAAGPVMLIGAVGDDAFGRHALDHFRREALDCRFVNTVPGEATGVALILVDSNGENMISVASGANLRLTPADVDAVPDEVFRAARVFLTCLESPLDTVARGLARAKAAGLKTILNPAPAHEDLHHADILRHVDILTPNEGEASALTGVARSDPSGIEAAARRLQAMGCRDCVITLGPRGCMLVSQDAVAVEGHRVEAVDTTAAGDAFNGALAVAISEGRTLLEAVRWATRAAAIAVTRPGAQPSLPTRAEIDAFQ
ncbi:MAG: ribokinase [Pirellulales bacterium]|nr:ribokinase [Pirellulales bacterium]